MRHAFFATVLMLCAMPATAHDNHTPYERPGDTWQLVSLNGRAFEAGATLTFPEFGRIAGAAPCNRYFGTMKAAFPWFKAEHIAATRRACPDLALEAEFLQTLEKMTIAEEADGMLILTGEGNAEMVFKARE